MQTLILFSGAGMSAESGISTFRDSGGLWENYAIEDVATPEAWNKNPDLVQRFYNLRRRTISEAKPNEAHHIIASLEKEYNLTVITQNIDDLHERAGSTNVVHLHGNIQFAKSSGPHQEEKYYPVLGDLDIRKDVCENGFPLRPHVVWFGEDVPNYEASQRIVNAADIFIVIGTSLNVYPAAGLIHHTPPNCRCFVIDPHVDELKVPPKFETIQMDASTGLKKVLQQLNN